MREFLFRFARAHFKYCSADFPPSQYFLPPFKHYVHVQHLKKREVSKRIQKSDRRAFEKDKEKNGNERIKMRKIEKNAEC